MDVIISNTILTIDLRIVCVSVKVTKLSKYICIRIIQELIIAGYCGSLLSRVVGLKHPFRNPSDILVQSQASRSVNCVIQKRSISN